MKHLKAVSMVPTKAQGLEEVPIEEIMIFVVAVLSAVATLLAAKETIEVAS